MGEFCCFNQIKKILHRYTRSCYRNCSTSINHLHPFFQCDRTTGASCSAHISLYCSNFNLHFSSSDFLRLTVLVQVNADFTEIFVQSIFPSSDFLSLSFSGTFYCKTSFTSVSLLCLSTCPNYLRCNSFTLQCQSTFGWLQCRCCRAL